MKTIPDRKDTQMNQPTYELRPLLTEIRDGYRGMRAIRTSMRAVKRDVMRAARAERRSLRRDLASYNTPGDRASLEAVLARYDDEQTAGIRGLVPPR
jgi:hypothetical protein